MRGENSNGRAEYFEQMRQYTLMRIQLFPRERSLRRKYPGKHIAYRPGQGIVDSDKSESELVRRIDRKYEDGWVFIGTIDIILKPWDNHYEPVFERKPTVETKPRKKFSSARK